MDDKFGAFEKLNDSIMEIARTYSYWHNKGWDFGVGVTLRRAEIHTIKAIGDNEGINLTALAGALNVTKPTVSEKINKLAGYKLIEKRTSNKNNKEVMFFLTPQGKVAYDAHEKQHERMYELFENHFGQYNEKFLKEFNEKLDKFLEFISEMEENRE